MSSIEYFEEEREVERMPIEAIVKILNERYNVWK